MRVKPSVCVLLLIGIASWQAHPQDARAGQGERDTEAHGEAAQPETPFFEKLKSYAYRQARGYAQDKRRDNAVKTFAFLAVVVGWLQVWVMRRQARIAARQTDIQERLLALESPALFLEVQLPGITTAADGTFELGIQLMYRFLNRGRMPALVTAVGAGIEFRNKGDGTPKGTYGSSADLDVPVLNALIAPDAAGDTRAIPLAGWKRDPPWRIAEDDCYLSIRARFQDATGDEWEAGYCRKFDLVHARFIPVNAGPERNYRRKVKRG